MKRRSSITSGVTRGIAIPVFGGSGFIFILLAASILFVSLFVPAQISGIRMKATDIAAPVLNAVVKPVTDLAHVVRNVSGIATLQAENASLQAENTRLKEWYQTALLLQAENASLKDLLNVKLEPRQTSIAARVLSDTGSAFAKSLLVSAGSNDGVKKGQAVMASQGLIGRVIEVGEHTARILLITDINSRVPVLIEDSRQHAILAGIGKGDIQLTRLSPEAQINEKARIITSGHGGVFPPGLAIGYIGKGTHVMPFADFERLTHIRIIDNPQNNLIAP